MNKIMINNSRKMVLLLLLMLALCQAKGQGIVPSFEWVKQVGGTGADAGQRLILDDTGNIYMAGEFNGTVDFDPGTGVSNLTAVGTSDAYVAKYTPAGALVWATRVGAAQGASVMTMDASGNIYMIPNGGYIAKLNNSGVVVWSLPVNFTNIYDITTDNTGNVYLTGIFMGTVDFDPGPGVTNLTATATYNTFVLKLDASGALLWAKPILSNANAQGKGLVAGDDGYLYLTGYFQGIADFDGGTGTASLTAGSTPAAFIAKWTLAGNYVWAKTTQGSTGGTAQGEKITLHPLTGELYLMGTFTGTVDFDPGPGTSNETSNGASDIFVLRMDTSAALVWSRRMGGNSLDMPLGIAVDTTGAAYTTGVFGNLNSDFDPGPAIELLPFAGGNRDIFVSKLKGNGDYAWARSIGSPGIENGRSIAVDKNLNVYTTGFFQGAPDFNTGTSSPQIKTSAGGNDIYLHKFYQFLCVPTTSIINAIGCETYTLNGQTYTASGVYTQTLVNSIGCDSLLTIELTITSPFVDTLFQNACDSFVFNDVTYYQSGTYTQSYISIANCDSIRTLVLNMNAVNTQVNRAGNTLTANATGALYQWINCNGNVPVPGATNSVFNPTQNGAYAVIITQNNCTDTSYCFAVTGITDLQTLNELTTAVIYPNPNHGQLSVMVPRPLKDAEIRIVNVLGQTLLHRRQLVGTAITIDMTSYASGVYFLELTEAGAMATFKLIKE